jgi:cephalosporin hydroxylase
MVKFLIDKLIADIRRKKYPNPTVKHSCKSYPEVNNWIISEFVTKQVIPLIKYTPYPIAEINLMVASICQYKPTHILEWGTNVGKSARIFYETVKAFSISSNIISIDLPDDINHSEHPHNQRGLFVKNLPEVTLLTGDGLDTAIEYLDRVKSKNLRPLFFLDGDHAYSSVLREISAIARLYPTAAIMIHDTFYQEPGCKYNVGPHIAVDEIIQKYPKRYYRIETTLGLPGMTVLLPVIRKRTK